MTGSTWLDSVPFTPDGQPFTALFIVNLAVQGNYYLMDDINGSNRIAVLDDGPGPYVFAGTTLAALGGLPTGTACVYGCLFNSVSSEVYVDNMTTPILSGDTGTGTLNSIRIGARWAMDSGMIGTLAEVIIFNGILTPTDKANLVDYLNVTRAYGIPVT